jgi:hypothetical protein
MKSRRKQRKKSSHPRVPHKLLIVGVFTVLFGLILTLRTTNSLPSIGALWPVPLILLGLFLLYMAFFKDGPSSYVFMGIFFTQVGVFFLFVSAFLQGVDLVRYWPFFMTFAGISLLAYGLRKHGRAQLNLVLPAASIVLLSLVFLPFSLGFIRIHFREFVLTWWPSLIVVLGVAFIAADMLRKNREAARVRKARETGTKKTEPPVKPDNPSA